MQEKEIDVLEKTRKMPTILQFAGIVLFVGMIVMFGVYKGDYIASEFIYKQF